MTEPAPDQTEDADYVIGTITIVRYLTAAGEDLVGVDTDDGNGERLGVVEALGLLELAKYDVCNYCDDEDDDPDDEDE